MKQPLHLAGQKTTIEVSEDSGIYLVRGGQRIAIAPEDLNDLAEVLGARSAHGVRVLLAGGGAGSELEEAGLAGADATSAALHFAAKREIQAAEAKGIALSYLEAVRRVSQAKR